KANASTTSRPKRRVIGAFFFVAYAAKHRIAAWEKTQCKAQQAVRSAAARTERDDDATGVDCDQLGVRRISSQCTTWYPLSAPAQQPGKDQGTSEGNGSKGGSGQGSKRPRHGD